MRSLLANAFALVLSLGVDAHAQDAAIFKRAKAELTKTLIDPYSVRFEELRVVKRGKGWVYVCGTFNAKNRMGGYVGAQPFMYVEDKSIYTVKPGDGTDGMLPIICG